MPLGNIPCIHLHNDEGIPHCPSSNLLSLSLCLVLSALSDRWVEWAPWAVVWPPTPLRSALINVNCRMLAAVSCSSRIQLTGNRNWSGSNSSTSSQTQCNSSGTRRANIGARWSNIRDAPSFGCNNIPNTSQPKRSNYILFRNLGFSLTNAHFEFLIYKIF